MNGKRMRRAAVGLAALLTGLAGCSGDETAKEVAAMNTSNIQRVANLYAAHQTYKGGRGPASETEFRTFISQFEAAKLEMMKVNPNDLDGLFKSERDGKPFKVRYNVGGGRGAVAAVVFEQDGQNGKRQVAYAGNAKVEEVDEATYQQLLAGKAAGSDQPVAAKGGGRPTGPPVGAPKGPPQ
jgi:hypothetical protein